MHENATVKPSYPVKLIHIQDHLHSKHRNRFWMKRAGGSGKGGAHLCPGIRVTCEEAHVLTSHRQPARAHKLVDRERHTEEDSQWLSTEHGAFPAPTCPPQPPLLRSHTGLAAGHPSTWKLPPHTSLWLSSYPLCICLGPSPGFT